MSPLLWHLASLLLRTYSAIARPDIGPVSASMVALRGLGGRPLRLLDARAQRRGHGDARDRGKDLLRHWPRCSSRQRARG